jgi:2-polyprenyl-3-methyl-5-hydroxy-6-metoxy-1,4-benzoquinol methylase
MTGHDEKRDRTETAVRECYSTWGSTYYKEYYGANAPYPPVHTDLIRGLVLEAHPRTVLDAGCGPASFLRHLAKDGLDLYGFDLTAEMVDEGKRVFAELNLDPARIWTGSVLDSEAYRSPRKDSPPEGYDAAVCVGVLPHIPAEHDDTVFRHLAGALRSGALAVVEARNQLFSLFTLNRPSYEFVRNELIRAEELTAKAGPAGATLLGALESMKSQFRMDLPPIRRGKAGEPGYDEVVSRTHNPLTLREQFAAAGFRDVRVLFYHFHSVPPMFANAIPDIFLPSSLAMENPADWRGYFMASAFLLVGRKV